MIEWLKWIMVSVLMIAMGGCAPKLDSTLTLAMTPWPGYEFLYLAEEKGFFERVGLKVQLLQFGSLSDSQRAYMRGYTDGLTATMIEVVQIQEFNARPLKVVILTDYSNGGDVIISSKNLTQIADLKGLRIGCEVSSLGIYVLARALKTVGLSLDDVIVVNTEQSDGDSALMSGAIDAFVSYPPYSTRLQNSSEHHVLFSTKKIPNEIMDMVAISQSVLEQDPSIAVKLREVWALALAYYHDHPVESVAIMAEKEGISAREFTEFLQDQIRILNIDDQKGIVEGSDARFLSQMQDVCTVLRGIGSLQSDCSSTLNLLFKAP